MVRVLVLLATALAVALGPVPAAAAQPSSSEVDAVVADATALQEMLNRYWSDQLTRHYGLTFDVPDTFNYYFSTGDNICGGASDIPNNAYFCRQDGNEFVAFDMNWFVAETRRHGSNSVTYLVLAHEWGHAVQDTWVEQQPQTDVWNPAYLQELNADCLAGVFLADAIQLGWVTEERGDAATVYRSLFEGGAGEWYAPGDHGTSRQRQQAFLDGTRNDVRYCRTNY